MTLTDFFGFENKIKVVYRYQKSVLYDHGYQ